MKVLCIGGLLRVLCTFKLHITFYKPNIVIDAMFLFLDQKVPTFLSMRDIKFNVLEISIQY